uniref:uncharacterized protein LOC122596969 n=1 Tax=Erigeron canadensis TaxID=72917 RepID=UPI001CB97DCF|nr:uncharacterized protein LOC122596969 [Erigeron canadensis]
MIKDLCFDGRHKRDPHEHLDKFEMICNLFNYGENQGDNVKMKLLPMSLTGEAHKCLKGLAPDSLITGSAVREALIERFFAVNWERELRLVIRSFRQDEEETIVEAWLRMKDLMWACPGHGVSDTEIVGIFLDGMNKENYEKMVMTCGGSTSYKTSSDLWKMFKDMAKAQVSRSPSRDKRSCRVVARVDDGGSSEVISEIRVLSNRMNERFPMVENNFGGLEHDVKIMAGGCVHCGGPHHADEYDSVVNEDVNFVQNQRQGQYQPLFQRGGNYQGRHQGSSSNSSNFYSNNRGGNFQNRWQKDDNRGAPQQQQPPSPPKKDNNGEEGSPLMAVMAKFLDKQEKREEAQEKRNASLENYSKLLNDKIEGLHGKIDVSNHNNHALISNLEKRIDRLSNQQRQPGTLPSNTQQNPSQGQGGSWRNGDDKYKGPQHRNETVNAISTRSGKVVSSPIDKSCVSIVSPQVEQFDEDVDEEVEMESPPVVTTPVPKATPIKEPKVKPYKPKVPFPQRLRKEKIQEQYNKFFDMIKSVTINVPLVDLISGMPNYAEFIKELVTDKKKLDEAKATILNEECSTVIKNKLPPKLSDLESFLIACSFGKKLTCKALANLGASINLMPNSVFTMLSLGQLRPTKMSIRLADHSFQYPLGVAENLQVQVGQFVLLVDFVILEMEEDTKVPLILGRPFLYIADAIIQVKDKEISLGVGEDRIVFKIEKALKILALSMDDTPLEDEGFEEIEVIPSDKLPTSIDNPPTDLELKSLPDHLEYAFLEGTSLLPIVISSSLAGEAKARLMTISYTQM